MMILIGYISPFKDRSMNVMELVNESFIITVTYHFYTFTDFTPDVKTREQVGKSLIAVTICSMVTNFGLITFNNVSLLLRKLKLWWLECKRDNEI